MSLESQLHRRADNEFERKFRSAREPLSMFLWDLMGERGYKLLDGLFEHTEIVDAYSKAQSAHRESYIAAFLKKCDEASAARGEGA